VGQAVLTRQNQQGHRILLSTHELW
jgi:hypothetical protein